MVVKLELGHLLCCVSVERGHQVKQDLVDLARQVLHRWIRPVVKVKGALEYVADLRRNAHRTAMFIAFFFLAQKKLCQLPIQALRVL